MTDRMIVIRQRTMPEQINNVAPKAALGILRRTADGWRFFPLTGSHKPSRRGWPTWEKALPRWTGGLDRTESRAMLAGQTVGDALRNFADAPHGRQTAEAGAA